MYATLSLSPAWMDVDRRNPSQRPGGGKLTARVWLAVAFGLFVAVWLFFRLNGYFVR
jgi:hypothetical protein